MSSLAETGVGNTTALEDDDGGDSRWERVPARPRRQWGIDAGILAFMLVACLVTVRPLYEEWAFSGCRTRGLSASIDQFVGLVRLGPSRPLGGVTYFFACGLSDSAWWGWAVTKFLLFAAMYLIVRWMTKSLPTPLSRLLAVCLMLLVPWTPVWATRYLSAHTSSILTILSLAFLLRAAASREGSWRDTALSALCAALGLASYQGPVVTILVLPVVVAACATSGRMPNLRRPAAWLARFGGPWVGLVSYAAAVAVLSLWRITDSYESQNLQVTSSTIVPLVIRLWSTAYSSTVGTAAPLVCWLLFGAAWGLLALRRGWLARWPVPVVGVVVVMMALLPLAGLPFAVNKFTGGDPDRVWQAMSTFALSLSLVFVLSARTNRVSTEDASAAGFSRAMAQGTYLLTLPVLAYGLLGAISFGAYGSLQSQFLQQVGQVISQAPPGHYTVRDESGLLGDTFTVHPWEDNRILHYFRPGYTFTLCTAPGTDRDQPLSYEFSDGSYATILCGASQSGPFIDIVEGPGGRLSASLSDKPSPVILSPSDVANPLECREINTLGTDGTLSDAQLVGFSQAEAEGRWTSQTAASVSCAVPQDLVGKPGTVTIVSAGSYGTTPQKATVSVGKATMSGEVANVGGQAVELTLHVAKLSEGDLQIRMELPDAHSPVSVGAGDDKRDLGLFVKEIRLSQD